MTIRGLWTHAEVLYMVSDGSFYSIDSAGIQTFRGTLNSVGGIVDFTSTLSQLCINDGSYLYVYNPVTLVFTTTANYPGGDRISFLAQRVNFLYRATQQVGWTALGDATSIDPLDFISAESSPDLAVSQIAFQNELWVFGTESAEIFDPTDATIDGIPTVYQKSSAAIDFGTVAAHSVQKTPNAVYWVSRDKNGQAMILTGLGHQAQRISTRYEEEKLAAAGNLSQARAYCFSAGGSSYYALNAPGLNSTLFWDETFQRWHERAEWNGQYSAWSPTCHAFAYGLHFFGCGATLAVSDRTVNNFLGNPKARERTAPVLASPDNKRHSFPLFEMVCDVGTNASVQLQWSDDGGFTWSNTHTRNTGATGNYQKRLRWTRTGNSFHRVYKATMTDDASWNPVLVNIPIA